MKNKTHRAWYSQQFSAKVAEDEYFGRRISSKKPYLNGKKCTMVLLKGQYPGDKAEYKDWVHLGECNPEDLEYK